MPRYSFPCFRHCLAVIQSSILTRVLDRGLTAELVLEMRVGLKAEQIWGMACGRGR